MITQSELFTTPSQSKTNNVKPAISPERSEKIIKKLTKCVKCGRDATKRAKGGDLYCLQCGRCKRKVLDVMKGVVVVRKECKRSVEDFAWHERLGIYVCPCFLEFDEFEKAREEEMRSWQS